MNDPELDRLLRTWQAPAPPAEDFRRAVWQRLAHAEITAPRWQRWLVALLRPRFAAAGFAAALIAGTAAGLLHAPSHTPAVADSTSAYIQSINPLDPMHLRHAPAAP